MDLVQRAHEVGNVEVLGTEQRSQAAMHGGHIFRHGPIGGNAAQRALPGVQMGVDQPRQHDAIGGVDHLRAVRRRKLRRNRRNAIVLDQYVAGRKVRDPAIHGDQCAALDQNPAHVHASRGSRRLGRNRGGVRPERYDIHGPDASGERPWADADDQQSIDCARCGSWSGPGNARSAAAASCASLRRSRIAPPKMTTSTITVRPISSGASNRFVSSPR